MHRLGPRLDRISFTSPQHEIFPPANRDPEDQADATGWLEPTVQSTRCIACQNVWALSWASLVAESHQHDGVDSGEAGCKKAD